MHISLSKDNVVQGCHSELGLPVRILFASNSLKLCFKIFFFAGVCNYCEERISFLKN